MLTSSLSLHNASKKLLSLSLWLGINLIFSTTAVFASNCKSTDFFCGLSGLDAYCACNDYSLLPPIQANIKTNSGGNVTASSNIALCIDNQDTVCAQTLSSPLVPNGSYYFKNISFGATDYFYCKTDGSGRPIAGCGSYTPSSPNCVTSSSYFSGTSGDCFCGDAGYVPIAELLMNSSGVITSQTDAGRCIDNCDTACNESSLVGSVLAPGKKYYFKNKAPGATVNYFFYCETDASGHFTFSGLGSNPLEHTPAPSCTSSPSIPPPLPPPPKTTVTVAFGGTGQGKVTSNPVGIDCQSPTGCSYTFQVEGTIELIPQPIGQTRFQNWNDSCRDGKVSANGSSKYCVAYFIDTTPPTHKLTVAKSGKGVGVITATGIDCGADCVGEYTQNTRVSVSAQAAAQSKFMGWQDDCSGTDNPFVVIMNSDKRCTAIFDVLPSTDPATDPTSNPTADPVSDPVITNPTPTDSPASSTSKNPRYGSVPSRDSLLIIKDALGNPSSLKDDTGNPTTTLIVMETGDTTLEVSTYDFSGENKDQFGISVGAPPFSIPDESPPHLVTIYCVPNPEIAQYATLTLTTNDPTQTVVGYPLICEKTNQPPLDILLSNDSLAEDSLPGKQVGTLTTLDPDGNDVYTYTLLDDAGGYFVLTGKNNNTLRLAQNAQLNRPQNSSYTLTVRSTDAGGLFMDKQFTIQITEAATFRGEIYTQDDELLGSAASVDSSENFRGVGYIQLSAGNENLGESVDIIMIYHWQPDGKEQDAILTVPVTLVRQTTLQETMQIHLYAGNLVNLAGVFTVDLGYRLQNKQLIYNTILKLAVRPNRPPTEITLSSHKVKENSPVGTVIGTLTTTDPDKGDWFVYDRVDDPNNQFAIVGDKLTVGYGFPLDFETQASYPLTVRSIDASGGILEKSFTLIVENEFESRAMAEIRGSDGFLLTNQPLTFTESDSVRVWAHLFPEASHIGQLADVTLSYRQTLPTGENLEETKVLAGNQALTQKMDFILFTGQLIPAVYQLTLGYQLVEGDYQFEQSVLNFTVTDAN